MKINKLISYKKIAIVVPILFISVNAFASKDECLSSIKIKNWDSIIKYCTEYANKDQEIVKVVAGAYAYKNDGLNAQKYGQMYIDDFSSKDHDKSSVSLAYMSLGNYYYFGEDGAKKDIKKGLEYITKGAELGNVIAQNQLGNFYLAKGEYPSQNMSVSYKWFQVASINGSQKAKQSYVLSNLDSMKKEAGYCLAMGEQLVAQAYLDGADGLPKDKSQAKKYLSEAVELYKKGKPSEEELKYCPKQKGLDLKSAEKLLGSL